MDAIDQKILRELRRDGRISNVALAERVSLSPSACLKRVQELERTAVILGYRVVTSPERMGRGLAADVMVGLSSHTKAAQEGFERAMTVAPEVVECHNIAGPSSICCASRAPISRNTSASTRRFWARNRTSMQSRPAS